MRSLHVAIFTVSCILSTPLTWASVCDTKYASPLLVSPLGKHDLLAQRGLVRIATFLNSIGVEVEAAAESPGPWEAEFAAADVPFHPLGPPLANCSTAARQMEDLHDAVVYRGLVLSTPNLWHSLRCLPDLAGAFTLLWVHGPYWPPSPTRPPSLELLLRFDAVCFDSPHHLLRTTALLNPLRHAPINFHHVAGSLEAHPIMETLISHASPDALPALRAQRAATLRRPRPPAAPPSLLPLCPAGLHGLGAKLAVVFHLARYPSRVLQPVLRTLDSPGTPSTHVWVTYLHPESLPALRRLARIRNPTFHPLLVRNHGLDIGPFFVVLWQHLLCDVQYEYVLKFHIKSDRSHPYAQNAERFFMEPGFLLRALRFLDDRPELTAIYPRIPRAFDLRVSGANPLFLGDNLPYIEDIQRALPAPLPIPRDGFVAGTIWLARAPLFRRWLRHSDQLRAAYTGLNDLDGVDWRWYSRNVLNASCSRHVAMLHYYHAGRRKGLPGHCYSPALRNSTVHYERDGMTEHAWERVLSFMLSAHGPWLGLR